jgi:hypothetical protein
MAFADSSEAEIVFIADAIVTGSFSVQGLNEAIDTAIISGATYSDANTNPVMAAPDVGTITVGGIAGTLFYTDLSFSLTNNLRAQAAIGQVGAAGIGYGRREVAYKPWASSRPSGRPQALP